ncbi:MAG: hypothetical protein LBT54_03500 [Bifidobacteriaceae bacterium]|jgi:Arc/MetJ-type ribon-helix-helix transcriptional regulator|nr:hypothetical protein [Bifidobacteriaceae bacterium]
MSITLPNGMADALRDRVRSGDHASESEVIREGLRALFARDRAAGAWPHGEVAAAYDALAADPSRAISPQQLRERPALEDTAMQWHTAFNSPLNRNNTSPSCIATLTGSSPTARGLRNSRTAAPLGDIRPALRTLNYKKRTVIAFAVLGDVVAVVMGHCLLVRRSAIGR